MPRAWEGRAAFGKSCQLVDEYVRRGAWALPPPTPGCDASRHWPPMQKEPVFGKIWHYVKTGSYALPAADAPPVTAALRARLATALGPAPADGAADGGEALIAELVDWCVAAKGATRKATVRFEKSTQTTFQLPTRTELYMRLPAASLEILHAETNGRAKRSLEIWAGFVDWVVSNGVIPVQTDGAVGKRLQHMRGHATVTEAIRQQAVRLVESRLDLGIELKKKLLGVLNEVCLDAEGKKARCKQRNDARSAPSQKYTLQCDCGLHRSNAVCPAQPLEMRTECCRLCPQCNAHLSTSVLAMRKRARIAFEQPNLQFKCVSCSKGSAVVDEECEFDEGCALESTSFQCI